MTLNRPKQQRIFLWEDLPSKNEKFNWDSTAFDNIRQQLSHFRKMHAIWDEITVTAQTISHLGIASLTQPLSEFNRSHHSHKIKLVADDAELVSEIGLRLALLSNFAVKGSPNAKWLLTSSQELLQNPNRDLREFRIVFLISEEDIINDEQYDRGLKTILVKQMRQIIQIIAMSEVQLQRRLKMEAFLNKSKQKYIHKATNTIIEEIATRYLRSHIRKDVKMLKEGMSLLGKRRKNILRKYFTQWIIYNYESQINRQEEELVAGEYLQGNANRKLLSLVFSAWKKNVSDKVPSG